jgi:trehalose 6-phosphate phosphatase
MELISEHAQQRWDALVAVAPRAAVGLDFDGTLSPIVDDPTTAVVHPEVPDALADLARVVAAVAVITGRPAAQAIELGSLAALGERVEAAGSTLRLFGQYGDQRWTSAGGTIDSPPPPAGIADFLRELPGTLLEAGAEAAYVEEKGLAVGVHTRRLPDPGAAYAALLGPLTTLAQRHGLSVEPGKHVVEVRAGDMHKGIAVTDLVDEVGAAGFLYAGDDLGDLAALDAVERLAVERGLAPLLVCADPRPDSPLRARADVVVDGPAGLVALLRRFVAEATAR